MMADNDHSNKISEFCKVTGADPVRAQHYLEATGWDRDLALSSYFEESEDSESSASMLPRPGSPKPKPNTKPKVPTSRSTGSSRITTFANLRQNEESDEEEGQAFYAGGSERSGQQVLGPSKRKAVNEIVQDMFKAVRTFGVEEVDHSKRSASGSKVKAFRGTGYVLGSTPKCSDAVPGGGQEESPSEPLDICLRLWQAGFTVDDGPLREYSDPRNREFLDTVRKGEIPMELRHKANGGEVHVKLEDHSHEEYAPKKPQVHAFAGTGSD
uniref:NSFL1 cofactor p47 n=1 Tax=Lycosa singoriensis TaxID=434756 RepID=A9QQ95_LYCSI|nr:NSFL1 cofactor p47 [Lycosa singoriensis]